MMAATLPGYATVAQAGARLHLAPRSVRDLIYTGRLPSLRIGRLHYIRAADLEAERRRRRGLPIRRPHPRVTTPRPRLVRAVVEPRLRQERAAERLAERIAAGTPRLPFKRATARQATVCRSCRRSIQPAEAVLQLRVEAGQADVACRACGRRHVLAWADRRVAEAAAARQLGRELAARSGGELRMQAA
jgi:hypothetical protein